jgi:prephenate dehydratase
MRRQPSGEENRHGSLRNSILWYSSANFRRHPPLMSHPRKANLMAKRVGFQGERGAYSEMAARAALGEDIELVPNRSFAEVFEGVQSGRDDLGIIAIENSLAGSIHGNYDLLLRYNLHIVAETQLRVEHCLIANAGVKLEDVKIVRSHPQALAQCDGYLRKLGIEIRPAYDTAGSVSDLRSSGARDEAAIASQWAAEVYEMNVLESGIEDDRDNYTRFLFLSTAPAEVPAEVAAVTKTSIVFALQNKPAALFRALACFALRDIDLTKIESRPIPGSRWDYRFYLDFIGSEHDGPGRLALGHLSEMATEMRTLGTYPRSV